MATVLTRRKALIAGTTLAVGIAIPAAAFATTGHSNQVSTSSHTLHITETDYHIALSSKSGKPGSYKFVIKNNSKIKHGIIVNGPGERDHFVGYVKAHKTITGTVKLRKGNYDIFCPVSDHKMLGMNTHLKIS